MSRFILEMEKVQAYRGPKPVLDIQRFVAGKGELIAIIGSNGAGKSTLLQVINGLLPVRAGEIRFYGRNIGNIGKIELRRRCAMVFQEPLFISGSVADNVALPLRLRGLDAKSVEEKVGAALAAFRCRHLAHRSAHLLSGGESQRVCLARAFISEPELLLLDEPFAALDSETRNSLLSELRQAAVERDMTVLLISHSLNDVLHFAQRVVVMEKGRIIQDDLPEKVLRRPVSPSVARLVGMDNIIPCEVREDQNQKTVILDGKVQFAAGLEHIGGTHCCLPGDIFRLGGEPSGPHAVEMEGTVERIVPGIGIYQAVISCHGLTFNVRLPRERACRLKAGEKTAIAFDPQEAHLM